jgi:putative DNA primase/helicase
MRGVGVMGAEFRLDFNHALSQLPEHAEALEQHLPSRAELLTALRPTADRWVRDIFPNGKLVDGAWRVADISGRAPRKQGSCVIELEGEAAGSYYDHSFKKGNDAVGTVADRFELSGLDVLKKAAEIAEQYGGRINGHASLPRRSKSASDHKLDAAHEVARSVPIPGTLAATYFSARGLPLPVCDDLRFSADCTHWETETKIATAKPALLAVIRYPDGRPTGGIHRIFLRDDGSGHLDKKMLGPADGGVVMLDMPLPGDTLGVAEGIETAAAAMQLSGIPCWSTLSAGGMPKFGAWLGANPKVLDISRLIVFADRDNAGESAAAALRDAAMAAGIQVEVWLPRNNDFADDLARGLGMSEPEILLPAPIVTIDDIEAEAKNLSPTSDIETISSVFRKLAAAQVSPLEEDRILETIRLHMRARIATLRDALKDAKRELGIGAKTVGVERRANWWSKLECSESGEPKPIMANIAIVLRAAEEWRRVLGYDKFANQITLRAAPPWVDESHHWKERAWTDGDELASTEWIQRLGVHAPKNIVFDGVARVASECPYHPVQDYLSSLTWDGVPRLDGWLTRYLGVHDVNPPEESAKDEEFKSWQSAHRYVEAIGARFLISAVARIFKPGAKADCVLILEGPQGLLKSTALSTIGDPLELGWFTDDLAELGTKDSQLQLAGVWFIELSELASMYGATLGKTKAYLSRKVDRFRPPYGRSLMTQPRQCVLTGTVCDGAGRLDSFRGE